MKIAFVWQGVSQKNVFEGWDDGLREALRYISEKHEVSFFEPWDDIKGDVVLYWEAPCTVNGANAVHYNRVRSLPIPKALLFAGGPLEKEWVIGFDLLFIESEINARECEEKGIKYKRAFGINDRVFKPIKLPKVFQGIHHGTCASWKRQALVGEALGRNAVLVGEWQDEDPGPFIDAEKYGANIIEELSHTEVALLINMSECLVQTSDYWGGGQRATLEAMACGIPVICMSDSPKNREFVEESGAGLVVDPEPTPIRDAVQTLRSWPEEEKQKGISYVQSKWTAKHYAKNLLDGICELV